MKEWILSCNIVHIKHTQNLSLREKLTLNEPGNGPTLRVLKKTVFGYSFSIRYGFWYLLQSLH